MPRGCRLKILGVLSLLALGGGCPSPSAPPAPPAEIPSLVNFPDSVGIDVSKIGGSAAFRLSKDQTAPGAFSDAIALGSITFSAFNGLLNDFLRPFSRLNIPVSPAVTSFEGPIDFAPGISATVKIDFSDFDLDGGSESCTGCTCPVGCSLASCPTEAPVASLKPVCYRIWLREVGQTEFSRFAAGRFDRYAIRDDPDTSENEENSGNGRFRLGVSTETGGSRNALNFGVAYEHLVLGSPLTQSTEFFVQDDVFASDGALTSSETHHVLVAQEDPTGAGDPEGLEKTVKLDFRIFPPPADDFEIAQYVGRFRDDFDFWSGSFHLEGLKAGVPAVTEETNLCARISTGNAASRDLCLDLGIDVALIPFLAPAAPSDSAFPADFPAEPPF